MGVRHESNLMSDVTLSSSIAILNILSDDA